MKRAFALLLSLLGAGAVCAPALGQPPTDVPVPSCGEGPACGSQVRGRICPDWTLSCFPRCGCPDDYCPHPFPRQCWPPYLPFYRCVPEGDCGPGGCGGRRDDRLTWWFLPTPRALREALWCQP